MTKKRRQTPATAGTAPSRDPLPADLANLGPEKRQLLQIVQQQRQISNSFSGPLPPPEILRAYNTVVPGLATAFIYGTASRRSERLRKAGIMTGKDDEATHPASDSAQQGPK